MKQFRADVKTIVSEISEDYRIEDGDNPQSLRVFVENNKVEKIDGLLKLAFPANIYIEVLPIGDEGETKGEEQSPLEDIATLLGVPMTKKGDDGETEYLIELTIGRIACACKYSNKKPNRKAQLLDTLKSMLGNLAGAKNVEVMGSGKMPEGLKELLSALGVRDGEPTPGCDCKRCEMLRELSKVPSDDEVH